MSAKVLYKEKIYYISREINVHISMYILASLHV